MRHILSKPTDQIIKMKLPRVFDGVYCLNRANVIMPLVTPTFFNHNHKPHVYIEIRWCNYIQGPANPTIYTAGVFALIRSLDVYLDLALVCCYVHSSVLAPIEKIEWVSEVELNSAVIKKKYADRMLYCSGILEKGSLNSSESRSLVLPPSLSFCLQLCLNMYMHIYLQSRQILQFSSIPCHVTTSTDRYG